MGSRGGCLELTLGHRHRHRLHALRPEEISLGDGRLWEYERHRKRRGVTETRRMFLGPTLVVAYVCVCVAFVVGMCDWRVINRMGGFK